MQNEIIKKLHVNSEIDVQKEIENRIGLLKDSLRKSGLNCYVLGISGGQDSSLTGKLIQLAIDQLNVEEDKKYKFIAMRLPYGIQQDEEDCELALNFIKPDETIVYNIKSSVDSHIREFENLGITISDFQKGNVKARMRMIAQYAIAGEQRGLVVGTDHAAEAVTGFFTKHGDGACDIAPIYGLNKRQGKELLKYLGAPARLYEKAPTADLEEERPALADEVALGVTYDQIDDYLEGKDVENDAKEKIENWYVRTNHKRDPIITL